MFVAFLRFVLFLTVVVGLPAFVIGTVTNGLLGACTGLRVRSRFLVSGLVGLAFAVGTPSVAASVLKSEEFGFLVTSGFVLVGAFSFIITSICVSRMPLRYHVTIACVLSVIVLWSIHVGSLDGVQGEVCAATLGDHTAYAPTYSTSGFRRVQVGMTTEQVQQLLGKPLDEWTPNSSGDAYWRWTRSGDGSHYYRYRVAVFRAGRLGEKSAYTYCDPMD